MSLDQSRIGLENPVPRIHMNAVMVFFAVRSLRLLCQACPYTLLCYSVWRMNSSLDVGRSAGGFLGPASTRLVAGT